MEKEFINNAKEYEKTNKKAIQEAWKKHAEFLELFPFRDRPQNIDKLIPDTIYKRGDKNAFLYWPEFGLKDLGRVGGWSASYAENARDNAEKFKELLQKAVNDSLSMSEKIDAPWEDIKFWGRDKIVAKKIIFCYYPKDVLPSFKTDDLEHFANILKVDFKKEAYDDYGKSYDMLSTGQQFEILNKLILKYKSSIPKFQDWDNLLFGKFLYDRYPPQRIRVMTREFRPLHSLGILFEPQYEQEVVYLFSVFHRDLDFPYIIKIRNEFPDALVMDKKRDVKSIEFEVKASDFIQHNHDPKKCDFIVCWENDLESYEDLPPIIALKDFTEELK